MISKMLCNGIALGIGLFLLLAEATGVLAQAEEIDSDNVWWYVNHLEASPNDLLAIGLKKVGDSRRQDDTSSCLLWNLKESRKIVEVRGADWPHFVGNGSRFVALTDEAAISEFSATSGKFLSRKQLARKEPEILQWDNTRSRPPIKGCFVVEEGAAVIYFTDLYLGRFSFSDRSNTLAKTPAAGNCGFSDVSCSVGTGNSVFTVSAQDYFHRNGDERSDLLLNVWDQQSLVPNKSWTLPLRRQLVYAASISPDGRFAAAYVAVYPDTGDIEYECYLWNLTEDRIANRLIWSTKEEQDLRRTIPFSPDSKSLAFQTSANEIAIHDIASGKQTAALSSGKFNISAICFSTSGQAMYAVCFPPSDPTMSSNAGKRPSMRIITWRDVFKSSDPSISVQPTVIANPNAN